MKSPGVSAIKAASVAEGCADAGTSEEGVGSGEESAPKAA